MNIFSHPPRTASLRYPIPYLSINQIAHVQLPPPLYSVPPRRCTCGEKTSLLQRIACSPRIRSHIGKCPSCYRGAPCHCRSCGQPKGTHLIRRSRHQHSRNIDNFYRATSSVHRLNTTSRTSAHHISEKIRRFVGSKHTPTSPVWCLKTSQNVIPIQSAAARPSSTVCPLLSSRGLPSPPLR